MNKAELIEALAVNEALQENEAYTIVNMIFDDFTDTLTNGGRIEIRGFGSFTVREYGAYTGRNPKTGAKTQVGAKKLPFFKVGKELKARVNGCPTRVNVACVLVNNEHDLKEILKVKDKVFVLFYASWCPFCVRFLPIFQKHAEGKGRHFVIVQDDQETIADQYSVKVYPTVLFFENGIVSKRLDGLLGVGLDEKQLVEFVSLCPLS